MKKLLFLLFILPNFFTGFSQALNPTGQVLNQKEVIKLVLKAPPVQVLKDFPEAVSLKPYAPSPASQTYVNCYAYASVYAGRTILYNVTQNEIANPDRNIFSTGFIQKLIYNKPRKCRNNGADTHYACSLMEREGVVKKADYPVDCSNQDITADLKASAGQYRIAVKRLFAFCATPELKINAVIASLTSRRPVVIGINSIPSFHDKGGNPDLWEPTAADRRLINCNAANHAVCIIGYDKNKYGGAFEIQNSWGLNWKADGRIWIRFNDLADFMMFAIELSNN